MNAELARLLAVDGVVHVADVPALRHAIRHAFRAGQVARVQRGVYAVGPVSGQSVEFAVRCRAALRYVGEPAALSHLSALAIWGLRSRTSTEPAHVTVPPDLRRKGGQGVVVHRRNLPVVVNRQGLPVTALEDAIVHAWPLLAPDARRAPVIEAVAGRRTTVERLRMALGAAPHLAGRGDLVRLLDLLAAGCRSPLEIWGLEHVFRGPGMPEFHRQEPLRIGERVVYLDVFAPAERVNFELDGAGFHSGAMDRGRDLRRDAALAARGIVVVRFTHRRLVHEPAMVRHEVLAVLAARRSQAA